MRRYRMAILSTLILIAGSIAHPPAALAQPVCGTHQSIAENLKKSYAETPVSMGITSGGGIIEFFLAQGNLDPGHHPAERRELPDRRRPGLGRSAETGNDLRRPDLNKYPISIR